MKNTKNTNTENLKTEWENKKMKDRRIDSSVGDAMSNRCSDTNLMRGFPGCARSFTASGFQVGTENSRSKTKRREIEPLM